MRLTREIYKEINKILDDEFKELEKGTNEEIAMVVYCYKQVIKKRIKDLKEKEE